MPTCSVPGCGLNPIKEKIRLHSFPLEATKLFKVWKERTGITNIDHPLEGNSKGKRFICSRHFIKECQSPGTNRLRKFSLPTISCPGFKEEPSIENSFLYVPEGLQSKDSLKDTHSIFVDLTENNVEVDYNTIAETFVQDREQIDLKISLDDNTISSLMDEAYEDVTKEIKFMKQTKGVCNEETLQKVKVGLMENRPISKKYIQMIRNYYLPRRLNISKPLGFSRRQNLSWKIFSNLRHNFKKIRKKKSKNILKEIKKEDAAEILATAVKEEVISTPSCSEPLILSSELNFQEPDTTKMNHSSKLLKSHFRITDEFIKSKNFNILTSKIGVNPLSVRLLTLQMKTKFICPAKQKFSIEDKIFALSLYKKYGRKKYKELSEYCALPTVKSLSMIMDKVPFSPGVHIRLFENLKQSVMKLDELDKYCSVIFCEIPLIEYSETVEQMVDEDELLGVNEEDEEEVGKSGRSNGDNVVLVMLRGLNRDWRQLVAFEVTHGFMMVDDLIVLLRNVIIQSLSVGFRIIAVVFNKVDRYRKVVSILNSESLLNLKETNNLNTFLIDIDQPSTSRCNPTLTVKTDPVDVAKENTQNNEIWNTGYIFQLENHEISLIYNPSSLLRSIRNKWLTDDITYTSCGKLKYASWRHIMQICKADEGSEDTKLCPKLTNRHVNPIDIDKNSIRCCVELFSQNVSSVMRSLAKFGVYGIDSSAKDTADLLLFFDKLFDSVNGTSVNSPRGKPLRCSLTTGSSHRDFWRSIKPLLASMKFTRSPDGENDFHLWLATLGSFHRMYERVLNHNGVSSINLGHLNCDPLEKFVKHELRLEATSLPPPYDLFLDTYKKYVLSGENVNITGIDDYHNRMLDPFKNYIYDESSSDLDFM